MAVNKTPILKRCRSLGLEPAYLGVDKKSRRTELHRGRKPSEYKLQLREKQKAKFIYGVLEKPFRNYYKKAANMKGMTGENLMRMLESRLDNVVFRMGLARTRREARQVVDHKFILVNGKKVNLPSYSVKAGDVITVTEKGKSSQRFKDITEATGGRIMVDWIDYNADTMTGTIKALPNRDQIDVPVNEMLIVELYSK
ncbi:MAG: 30S ribosomal protein S4 [Lachnospiraceae bacterium]|uniref:Small ribosomal subunit protein uS4 n=1 Tax=Candidatus Weimeria bifida TaxID=2599074 RepID=A0A6N7IYL2_9FIRM|nr:30S ribosomal protein S4 [Candidatus Weimeria bifida]RRF94953.1 MAG: 30S ribosomal protein S4 [Lachnospiraceae bacterium]